jgi:hypothetical protein
MRTDPYHERVREAGLDPDARIERPGQKSMPAWCTFRDVACKEHMARETAAAWARMGDRARAEDHHDAVTDMVHNTPNCAWRENHGGRDLWVVRRARCRHSRGSAASSGARWVMMPLSWRGSIARRREHLSRSFIPSGHLR